MVKAKAHVECEQPRAEPLPAGMRMTNGSSAHGSSNSTTYRRHNSTHGWSSTKHDQVLLWTKLSGKYDTEMISASLHSMLAGLRGARYLLRPHALPPSGHFADEMRRGFALYLKLPSAPYERLFSEGYLKVYVAKDTLFARQQQQLHGGGGAASPVAASGTPTTAAGAALPVDAPPFDAAGRGGLAGEGDASLPTDAGVVPLLQLQPQNPPQRRHSPLRLAWK